MLLRKYKQWLRRIGKQYRHFNLSPQTHSFVDSIPVAPEGAVGNVELVEYFYFLLSRIRPQVFCDIGANNGEACLRAKKMLPETVVHAFEANPEIHKKFGAIPIALGIGWHNFAVTAASGPADIYIPRRISRVLKNGRLLKRNHHENSDTGKGSLLHRTEDADYDHHIVTGIKLDDFLSETDPHGKVALWIDVEGAASFVLNGATETLKRTDVIVVEVEGFQFWEGQSGASDVFQILIEAGFTPVLRDREYGDFQWNAVFIRNELVSDFFSPPIYPEQASIPAIVPSFNNPTYCELMLDQLWRVGFRDIRFVDNASASEDMLNWLNKGDPRVTIIRLQENLGPNDSIFKSGLSLPRRFCISDPDIAINPRLPANFVSQLSDLAQRHAIGKSGFALDLSRRHRFGEKKLHLHGREYTIPEWEEQFWSDPLHFTSDGNRVFEAAIDTTFCLIDRRYYVPEQPLNGIRVAGTYTARHLPWENHFLVSDREKEIYSRTQNFSNYGI